jgi:putative redox protein
MGRTLVSYEGGMRFVGEGKSGHPVTMDAAPEVGGADSAARPIEVLLCALGACTGMDVISLLRKMRTEPTALQIEVDDERETDYPKAIKKVHLVYRVRGRVPEANLRKAIDLSLSTYCPIANSLSGVAQITTEYVLEPDQ